MEQKKQTTNYETFWKKQFDFLNLPFQSSQKLLNAPLVEPEVLYEYYNNLDKLLESFEKDQLIKLNDENNFALVKDYLVKYKQMNLFYIKSLVNRTKDKRFKEQLDKKLPVLIPDLRVIDFNAWSLREYNINFQEKLSKLLIFLKKEYDTIENKPKKMVKDLKTGKDIEKEKSLSEINKDLYFQKSSSYQIKDKNGETKEVNVAVLYDKLLNDLKQSTFEIDNSLLEQEQGDNTIANLQTSSIVETEKLSTEKYLEKYAPLRQNDSIQGKSYWKTLLNQAKETIGKEIYPFILGRLFNWCKSEVVERAVLTTKQWDTEVETEYNNKTYSPIWNTEIFPSIFNNELDYDVIIFNTPLNKKVNQQDFILTPVDIKLGHYSDYRDFAGKKRWDIDFNAFIDKQPLSYVDGFVNIVREIPSYLFFDDKYRFSYQKNKEKLKERSHYDFLGDYTEEFKDLEQYGEVIYWDDYLGDKPFLQQKFLNTSSNLDKLLQPEFAKKIIPTKNNIDYMKFFYDEIGEL